MMQCEKVSTQVKKCGDYAHKVMEQWKIYSVGRMTVADVSLEYTVYLSPAHVHLDVEEVLRERGYKVWRFPCYRFEQGSYREEVSYEVIPVEGGWRLRVPAVRRVCVNEGRIVEEEVVEWEEYVVAPSSVEGETIWLVIERGKSNLPHECKEELEKCFGYREWLVVSMVVSSNAEEGGKEKIVVILTQAGCSGRCRGKWWGFEPSQVVAITKALRP